MFPLYKMLNFCGGVNVVVTPDIGRQRPYRRQLRRCGWTMASTRPGSKRGRHKLPMLNLRFLLKLVIELKFCLRRPKSLASHCIAWATSVVNTSTLASCVASSDFFPIFSDAMDAKAPCDQALTFFRSYYFSCLHFGFKRG